MGKEALPNSPGARSPAWTGGIRLHSTLREISAPHPYCMGSHTCHLSQLRARGRAAGRAGAGCWLRTPTSQLHHCIYSLILEKIPRWTAAQGPRRQRSASRFHFCHWFLRVATVKSPHPLSLRHLASLLRAKRAQSVPCLSPRLSAALPGWAVICLRSLNS